MKPLLNFIKSHILAVILISVFTLHSCDYSYLDGIDNMDDYTYEATFAVPLVNSYLNINDIIDTEGIGAIETDEEGLIWLVYKGRVFSIPAEDLFSIPNQSQSFTIDIDPVAKEEITFDRIFLVTFDSDQEVNLIKFRQGLFTVNLEDTDQLQADGFDIFVEFEILNSETGDGGLISGELTPQQPANIDLAESIIDFEDETNFFPVKFTVTISGDGNPVNAPYTIEFNQNMENMEYDYIYGFIGEIPFPVGDSEVNIDIFKSANIADIFFENPTMDVIAKNSFGTPITLNFNEFYASNPDDETIAIETAATDSWDIDMPDELGQTNTTQLELNRSNTNIDEMMSIRPTTVHFDVSGVINPAGKQTSPNFINYNSQLSIDLDVNLPLFGRVDNFELQDTLDLTFNNLPEEIDWAELKIQMDNGFPFRASVQVYFVDDNMQVLDSLFSEASAVNLIEAAPTSPDDNIVTEPRLKETFIMLDQARFESLRNAEQMLLEVEFNTYNQDVGESVKILESYEIGILMGLRMKAKVDPFEEDEE
ncbi:MAG: hypothetical protein ABR597_04080 [Bacteroidales bacterium]